MSFDGGASWALELVDTYIMSVAIDPTASDGFYAGGFQHFFRSVDAGTTWQAYDNLSHVANSIAIDPDKPSTLYAAVQETGVYMSPDSGLSWWPLREGLTTSLVAKLALRGSMLYVSTHDQGVFVRRLGPALQIIVEGGGYVEVAPTGAFCRVEGGDDCVARFAEPTDVTLTPTPLFGYVFDGWTGAPACSSAPFRVADVVLCRATFVPAPTTQSLTVTVAGGWKGLVTSTPAGIACPGTCSAQFATGTAITLAASPDAASVFAGWSGACTGTASCVVHEANNCRSSERTIAVQLPDLVTSSVSGPPQAAPGAAITLTDTAQNVGPVTAPASTTRYYLSADGAWDAADVLLTGTRSVPTLAPGQESAGSKSVTVPSTTALGTYRLLACADDLKKVREMSESNNCAASAATLLVGIPDLVTTAVGATSAAAVPGGKLTVSDTVRNDGNVVAGASTTRYYLSVDAIKDGTDLLLTGTRSVVSLPPGATSSGSKAVTLPSSTPLGTYRVIACADDLSKVSELSNDNNCLAGPSVLVGWPDLVVTEVSDPPAEATAGGKFVVSETVRNDGNVAAGASTTAYYLSLDAMKGAGDIQLTGVRSVSGLGAGVQSKGSGTVTVPAGTPAGTYQVLGCADSSLKVAESDETNNCRASAGSVTIR